MEIVGSFVDEDWESLSQIFSSGEENTDFFVHCDDDGSKLFSSNIQISPPTFDHAFAPNFFSTPQESSSNSTQFDEALFLNAHEDQLQLQQPLQDHESFINNDVFMLPVYPHFQGQHQNVETADSCQEMTLKRRKSQELFVQIQDDYSPNKKQRFSKNAHKSRKTKKIIQDKINEEGEGNGGGNSSEDDSNASQVVTNTKTRASATDPQSIYARKRRERINERLKILQNLVPNGTKVDISTMLEEAVHYVKFLQLQIKLLSSDNLWMYAPLAYNGMDIGIYQNISPNLRP